MLRVRTLWTGVPGAPWYSNLYFTGTTEAEATDAADAVGVMMSNLESLQPSTIDWTVEGEVAEIDPVTGNRTGTFAVTGSSGGGSNTGDPVPLANQIRCRLLTGVYLGGRAINGAFNFPGVTESAISTNGTVDVPSAQQVANALLTLVGTDPPALGVWSRKNGTFYLVTGITYSTEWAVLRSRRD